MNVVLITGYLAGWVLTTFLLLRPSVTRDPQHRAVLNLVGVACAIALAAVWPLSGWLLPMIRAALREQE
ncbi:hypothetical protein O6P37_17300 [Mycobacterium sp. CPCC 205372]|jgi:hypothetical protein|uniref:Uncharacterized protein n=1 Tax=Mycobacterium hippophais TaxID=3016340 RepID=A0ABT4PVR1_9MYCO|nr:hypothetical protein [Mycobacterium hippophais]MCZ8380625.1 hypothetical protein [Mycobacterium hippophais]